MGISTLAKQNYRNHKADIYHNTTGQPENPLVLINDITHLHAKLSRKVVIGKITGPEKVHWLAMLAVVMPPYARENRQSAAYNLPLQQDWSLVFNRRSVRLKPGYY